MRRTRPTTKLDVIGDLSVKPEISIVNYLESKLHEKAYLDNKPAYNNNSGETVESIGIAQALELAMVRHEQQEILELEKAHQLINADRAQKMYDMQLSIKDKFTTVSDFIRGCEEKEAAADEKIKTELRIQSQLRNDIEECKKTIMDLENFKRSLAETIKAMEPYETVIEEVVKKIDMLKSIKGCTNRCDSLMLAQDEIIELEQQLMKTIDAMHKDMITETNAAALTVLGLNNELAELERSYTNATNQALDLEEVIENTTDTIISHELKSARILDAIQHIIKLLCKRRGIDDTFARSDIEGQLDFIRQELEILSAVIVLCRQEQKNQTVKHKHRRRFNRK